MEIIFLVAVVALIYWKLNAILGKPIGFMREDFLQNMGVEKKKPENDIVELAAQRVGHFILAVEDKDQDNLVLIEKSDPDFRLEDFLEGACTAFSVAVEAFNKKNLATIRDFTTEDFWKILMEMVNNNNLPQIELLNFVEVKVSAINKDADNFYLTISYLTKQNSSDKNIVDVLDLWTFQKKLTDKDNNWLLSKIA